MAKCVTAELNNILIFVGWLSCKASRMQHARSECRSRLWAVGCRCWRAERPADRATFPVSSPRTQHTDFRHSTRRLARWLSSEFYANDKRRPVLQCWPSLAPTTQWRSRWPSPCELSVRWKAEHADKESHFQADQFAHLRETQDRPAQTPTLR